MEKDALYPFGFGLSYTAFKYGAPQLSTQEMNPEDSITVIVPVTNTGNLMRKEVVQLYIRDLVASTTRPVKELQAFEMIELAPGETKDVQFKIDEKMLQFYTVNKKWESEEGDFEVLTGGIREAFRSKNSA